MSAIPFAFWGAGGSAAFNVAALQLTVWQKDYAGAPWAGTASAGSSGSNSFDEATNPPAVGTALNGHDSADYDGTNDSLTCSVGFGSTISATAYSGWCFFEVDAIGLSAADAAPYDNEHIVGSTPFYYHGIAVTTNGGNRVQVYHHDGAWRTVPGLGISLSTPTLVQFRFNGTTLEARIGRGSWQSVAATDVNSLLLSSATQKFAAPSFTSGDVFDGRKWEYALIDQVLNDTAMDGVCDYIETEYGVTL